jgi:acylphosphatase
METVVILLSGKVQGVSFRSFARNLANKLHLTGYAVNLPDGNLEVLFQGIEENIKEAIRYCEKGPISSSVERIEITKLKNSKKYTGFEKR